MEFNQNAKEQLMRDNPEDSPKLFATAWAFINNNYTAHECGEGLQALYGSVVASFVNNPESEFYIHG